MIDDNYEPYETDASRIIGKAANVYLPQSIPELRNLVMTHERIVIRGAGTGLAGGSIPLEGKDTVIDLGHFNTIGTLDPERKTVEVEAGVILADLQYYLRKKGLEFPIDIASRNVATIGGMIAVNTSSTRGTVTYGRVGNWIHWIEIIDSRGNISRKGVTEISDYAGMEGTTGIIIKACLKLSPLRNDRSATLLDVGSLDEAVSIARNMKREPIVSMIEFFDANTSEWLGLGEGYHLMIEYEDDTGTLKGKQYEETLNLLDEVYLQALQKDYLRVQDPRILTDRFDKVASWLDENNIPFISHMTNGIITCFFQAAQEKHIPELMMMIRKMGGQISGSHGIGILNKEYLDIHDKKILSTIKKRTDELSKFNLGKLI